MRKWVGLSAIAVLTVACSPTVHAEARKLPPSTTTTTLAATTTNSSTTTTLPPPTTTTVPPTTTTTIATGMVPNAAEIGREDGAVAPAEDAVTQAGFTVQIFITFLSAC
jgi:hypothetical protein